MFSMIPRMKTRLLQAIAGNRVAEVENLLQSPLNPNSVRRRPPAPSLRPWLLRDLSSIQ